MPKTPTMPSSGNAPHRSVPDVTSSHWNEDTTPLTLPPRSSDAPPPSSEFPSSEPSSVRLPLAGGSRSLSGARIAIIDVDPTRTDALAVALRARGAEVHVASLAGGRAHFRLMRRFAPHALMIDEELMTSDGRQFVTHLRHDPFLSATLLIPVRFDRLFRRRSGTASVESILQILEPLGRAESDLLARLGPHLEVEFDLDQFPPHRLLRMLASRPAPTTLTCTREKETFRWTMSGGKMGRAELWKAGSPLPQRLNPDRALDWLLAHQNCHVVLSQPHEFSESTGQDVVPLVESQESGLWVLPENASVTKIKASYGTPTESLLPVETESVTAVHPAPPRSERLHRKLRGTWRWVVAAGTLAALGGLWIANSGLVPPTETQTHPVAPAPPAQVPAVPAAPVSPSKAHVLDDVQPTDKPKNDPAAVMAEEDLLATFFRRSDRRSSSCEEITKSTPPPQTGNLPLARQHWRVAQRQLVQGNNKEAHISLCQSALLDPTGPGSAHLASFALSRGDVQQAYRWASKLREAHPEDTSTGELFGDVLHQQGQRQQALEVWLSTLGVEASEHARRSTVARVWLKHAETALLASDHPRAERALRRAFEFDPTSLHIRAALTRLFQRAGDGRAEQWLRLSALRVDTPK